QAYQDVKWGVFTYADASHDPASLRRHKDDGKLSKKDLVRLQNEGGRRLGDQAKAKYEGATLTLNKRDLILCYTDGIIDLQTPAGETWGERKFLRTVIESAKNHQTVGARMGHLKSNISNYREASELVVDITLFMCQYEDVA